MDRNNNNNDDDDDGEEEAIFRQLVCVCGWVFFHLKKSNYIIYLVSFCFVFFLFCFDSFKFPFISSFDRLMATIMMICQLLMMMMML